MVEQTNAKTAQEYYAAAQALDPHDLMQTYAACAVDPETATRQYEKDRETTHKTHDLAVNGHLENTGAMTTATSEAMAAHSDHTNAKKKKREENHKHHTLMLLLEQINAQIEELKELIGQLEDENEILEKDIELLKAARQAYEEGRPLTGAQEDAIQAYKKEDGTIDWGAVGQAINDKTDQITENQREIERLERESAELTEQLINDSDLTEAQKETLRNKIEANDKKTYGLIVGNRTVGANNVDTHNNHVITLDKTDLVTKQMKEPEKQNTLTMDEEIYQFMRAHAKVLQIEDVQERMMREQELVQGLSKEAKNFIHLDPDKQHLFEKDYFKPLETEGEKIKAAFVSQESTNITLSAKI